MGPVYRGELNTHDETMMTGTPFSRHHLKKVLKPGSRTMSGERELGFSFDRRRTSPSWIRTLSQDLLTFGKAVAVGDHALKHLGERVSAG
jgi:hypothetical protein